MSGFGGFNTGSTGSGLFGDKPPEQGSSGFTAPTTTGSTVTPGLGFGTTTAFGTGSSNLFGAQQQTSPFGTGFGVKSPSAGTGFAFSSSTANAPTFGSTTTNTTAPSFGVTTTTTASLFNVSTTSTSIPTLGTFGTTNTSTPSSTPLTFNNPKTSGIAGFSSNYTFPVTSSAVPSFNFGLTTTAASSTPLTFGVQTTSSVTSATTVAPISVAQTTTTAPTLTFGVSTTGATSASIQSTGFTLNQPITTGSLTFGGAKTTKTVTFGTVTSGFSSVNTTAAPTFTLGTATTTTSSVGNNLFGAPRATETVTGITPASAGLGGVDNKQTTQGLSGPGTVEPKQAKDHPLPDPILQTLNEFQNFTKQQKSLSVEISHGSSKPLKKVQEDTEAMESLLTMITSGLTRNAIAVDKLKSETAQGLHQAELAQRNHETPPGLDYDNSAPADYFNDLVSKFETDTVRLRVQIEASEKHLRSLTQSSTISPQELTLAMRQLHETLIVLAARVQALHTSVQSQKEQYKNLRRVYFKDDTNIFENDLDQNLVKKQTIYSLRSLTGPTPFSENPGTRPPLNVDGLAVLANSTVTSVPASSANPRMARQFRIHQDEIVQFLNADDSGDETNLPLDAEDQEFLESDADDVGTDVIIEPPANSKNSGSNDSATLTTAEPIAGPSGHQPMRRKRTVQKIPERSNTSPSSAAVAAPAQLLPVTFKWRKSYRPFLFKDDKKPLVYGQVNMNKLSDSGTLDTMPTPLQIFEATVQFDKLVDEILLPESIRYMQQKGSPFSIESAEMKAFLGMNLVMSYHVLPALRSYWSTQPDLAVPYISQVMSLQRFEAVRGALHFVDNNSGHDPDDRAWKVRSLISHFNAAFQDILSVSISWQESTVCRA